jgi:hypothetical protein
MRRGGTANGVRPVWRERSRAVRLLRLWRTRNPVTFTEKVRYKMLRDHRPLVVTFADKAAARGYVASVVGADRLPRVHHVLEEPSALAELSLPDACVLKPTHGSGAAVIISAAAPGHARLPEPEDAWVYRHVRPDVVDSDDLVALGRAWLAQLYGSGPNREWVYGHVPRRILVEELLLGPDGQIPGDYKFFVFHGRSGPLRKADPGLLHPGLGPRVPERRPSLVRAGTGTAAPAQRDARGRRAARSGHRLRPGRPVPAEGSDRRGGAHKLPGRGRQPVRACNVRR